MSESGRRLHYKVLGRRLQILREKTKETLDEVSGAVEIETSVLQRIESGEQQPSEDILILLLTHFKTQDDEALDIWELAGYSQANTALNDLLDDSDDTPDIKPILVVVSSDTRVLYTDQVDVNATQHGVTLSFKQNQGGDAPQTISRMGMSREQARSLMIALHQNLSGVNPSQKLLPKPKNQ